MSASTTSTAHRDARRQKLELAWVIGVVLFTLGRFVVAYGTLRRYDINIWLFGFIDLATAVPYGVGTARLATSVVDRRYSAIAQWTMVAGASFLAPYLYIALEGQGMPAIVWIVLAVLVVAFGAYAILGVRKRVNELRSDDGSPAGLD